MQPSEDIKPITYMKTCSSALVRSVSRRRRPVVITQNGVARVVVQDLESFERDRKALLLLKILSQGVLAAQSGRVKEQDVVFERLEKKFFS